MTTKRQEQKHTEARMKVVNRLVMMFGWVMVVGLGFGWGQQQGGEPPARVPKVVPVPEIHIPKDFGPVEPKDPPARTVTDARTGILLRLPQAWNLTRKDGEISTFHLDARTAGRRAQMRLAASLGWNPFPRSTFSGALFYLSVTPGGTAATCAAETTTAPDSSIGGARIDDVKFSRGKDEHGGMCTEARDIAYTAFRHGSCVRFDLAVNTFCEGASGMQNMTAAELTNVFGRMEGILTTVKFAR